MKNKNNNIDLILLKLPYTFLQMPNGMGYVHNTLKKCGISFITRDLNIQFHGIVNNKDLSDYEFNRILSEYLKNISDEIVKIKPKIIAISVNEYLPYSINIIRNFILNLKNRLSKTIFIGGGYTCFTDKVAKLISDIFDHLVIRECENSLVVLIENIFNGKKIKDIPGVLSVNDSKNRMWKYAPLLKDLDSIDFPRYEWTDIEIYKDIAPAVITPNRGCPWARCNFCWEILKFRGRCAESLADEVEYLNQKGFNDFEFSCSDFNGDPKVMTEFCKLIIKRKIKVNFEGQMRIDKRNDRETFRFFEKAGFNYIRFGVDGWSDKAISLLNKGYDMKTVEKNLKYCSETKITTAVNLLTGFPGETEKDVDDYIKNINKLSRYIRELHYACFIDLQNG